MVSSIVALLETIPVPVFLIFFLIYFGVILFIMHRHFSKPTQVKVEQNCGKILEEFIANNDYPKINKSFDNLSENKCKLSGELNINLKGYTSYE